jgi:hypothetical protein
MKELTIGNFPDVGLSEARKTSREKRAQIDQLGDPAADKRRAKAKAMADWTITELIEYYRLKILDGLGSSTEERYGRSLEKISIRLGSFSVSQVSSSETVELIESARVPWSESKMLLTTARMLFIFYRAEEISTQTCSPISASRSESRESSSGSPLGRRAGATSGCS